MQTKKIFLRLSLFFLFLNHSINAEVLVDLRAPGESMENSLIYNQGDLSFCYAFSTAVMLNAYLKKNYAEEKMVSPFVMGLMAPTLKDSEDIFQRMNINNDPYSLVEMLRELKSIPSSSLHLTEDGSFYDIDPTPFHFYDSSQKVPEAERSYLWRTFYALSAFLKSYHVAYKNLYRLKTSLNLQQRLLALSPFFPQFFQKIHHQLVFQGDITHEIPQVKFFAQYKLNSDYTPPIESNLEADLVQRLKLNLPTIAKGIIEDYLLKERLPVVVTFCWNFLYDKVETPKDYQAHRLCTYKGELKFYHMINIIALKEEENGKRFFLLRNTHGNSCNALVSPYLERCLEELKVNQRADVWVEEDILLMNTYSFFTF